MSISEKVKIGQTGRVQCAPDWFWDKRGAPDQDFDLWVIADGFGSISSPEGDFEISAGDCFILRGSDDYFGETDTRRPLNVVYIHFEYLNADGDPERPNPTDLPPLHRKIDDFPFFLKILDRVVERCRQADIPAAETYLQTALMEVEFQDELNRRGIRELNERERLLDRLAREIVSSPERQYHLPEIAEKAGYSPDHLSKIFKARTGVSFRDWVIRSRIDKAKLLLRSSSMKVADIALATGYSDIYLFSKQFKKKTGRTPTEHREYRGSEKKGTRRENRDRT